MEESEYKKTLQMLEESPSHIAKLVAGVDPEILSLKPDENTWSAKDILSHISACADVWGEHIDRMLKEDHPIIKHVSPRGFMKKPKYASPSFAEAFQTFKTQRAILVKTLASLSAEDWYREATLKGIRQGHRTVLTRAQNIAEHEYRHLDQLNRTIKLLTDR